MAPLQNITNAIINDITRGRNSTLVTVTHDGQRIRLVVDQTTAILDERGNSVPVNTLRTGMTVNAIISSAMTKSIPPQASAFLIRIVRRPVRDNITVGRILDTNIENRNLTAISDGNLSSIIVFNLADNAMIFDRLGRPTTLSRLLPGMRVRVRHATFMTASIPPQTTAFEVRVL